MPEVAIGSARGADCGRAAMKVPRPTVEVTRPMAWSSSNARTTVFRCVRSSFARERVGGSRKPTGKAPVFTRSFTWSTICWYSGRSSAGSSVMPVR
jgi:hypothetical protein